MSIPNPWRPALSGAPESAGKSELSALINSTRFAYESFVRRCLGHDELRPVSGRCLDSYGFNATIVEAAETLFLLNQTDLFEHARAFIRENFSCSRIGWVNRREMFSRLVGSMIGSYLLTGDGMFLSNAEECTQRAISIDRRFKYPKPYHNYVNGTYRERMWVNGTALQDVSAGLPEMVALYHLTGKKVYFDYYRKIAKALPRKKGVFYYSVLTIPRGMNGTCMMKMDGFTVGFYHNLAIAHSLHPLKETEFALNKTEEITYVSGDSQELYPLLNAASYATNTYAPFQFSGVDNLYHRADDLYSDCSKLFGGNGFRFDGSFFQVLLRKGGQNEKIQKCVDYVLNRTKRRNGFSGLRSTVNSDLRRDDDVQPSHFLGQFVKVAALSLMDGIKPKYATLNERGHILESPALIRLPTNYSFAPCSKENIRGYNLFC